MRVICLSELSVYKPCPNFGQKKTVYTNKSRKKFDSEVKIMPCHGSWVVHSKFYFILVVFFLKCVTYIFISISFAQFFPFCLQMASILSLLLLVVFPFCSSHKVTSMWVWVYMCVCLSLLYQILPKELASPSTPRLYSQQCIKRLGTHIHSRRP